MHDIEKNKIGSGSYGTVYLLNDEFVVKIPINERGIKVDVNSPEHRNCHPDRVSKYLNMANGDKDFSRSAIMNINGKDVTVLVSKYIQGQEFDIEDEDNYRMAEALLESGVYMHIIDNLGNILVKEGYFSLWMAIKSCCHKNPGNSEALLLQQHNWKSKLRPVT